MTVIWIAIIAGGALIALLAWLTALDTARLEKYDSLSSKFYESAQPLADDADTPAEVLEVVGVMNRLITSKNGAILILKTMNQRAESNSGDSCHPSVVPFFERRPELTRAFVEASSSALLAATYRNRLIGWYVRIQMAIIKRHKSVAPMVAHDIFDDMMHKRGHLQAA